MISTQLSDLTTFKEQSAQIVTRLEELALLSNCTLDLETHTKTTVLATELQSLMLECFNDLSQSFSKVKKIKSELSSSKPKTSK